MGTDQPIQLPKFSVQALFQPTEGLQSCVNVECTIKHACARYKPFIEMTEDERAAAGHWWQSKEHDGDCDHWVIKESLRVDGQRVRQFNPRTKHLRRRGGEWSHG